MRTQAPRPLCTLVPTRRRTRTVRGSGQGGEHARTTCPPTRREDDRRASQRRDFCARACSPDAERERPELRTRTGGWGGVPDREFLVPTLASTHASRRSRSMATVHDKLTREDARRDEARRHEVIRNELVSDALVRDEFLSVRALHDEFP